MDATGETFETNAEKDLIVTRDLIQGMAGMFLGESGNRQEPLANPLHADLKGFPPICRGLCARQRTPRPTVRRRRDQDLMRVTILVVPLQHRFAGTSRSRRRRRELAIGRRSR